MKSHRPRIRYILARVHNLVQKEFDVNAISVENLMRTPNPIESGYHLDHVFPQSDSKHEFWRQSKLKDEHLSSSASRYLSSINSIGNLVLMHHEDNLKQSDALPWDEEKLQNLAKSELHLNRVLSPQEYWKHDERITQKLIDFKNKRNVTIQKDSWSEETSDLLAQLYWDILSGAIKKNFGITD